VTYTDKLVGCNALGHPKGCPILASHAFAEVLAGADAVLSFVLLFRFGEHGLDNTRHRVHAFFPPRFPKPLSEGTTAAEQVEDYDHQCDNKQDVYETTCKMKAEAE
jgi:hypothetical protein